MVALRLHQLADQAKAGNGNSLKTYRPVPAARQLIDIRPIWRAKSTERLEQALDKAQTTILNALNSDSAQTRLNAAKLMMRTKQARQIIA